MKKWFLLLVVTLALAICIIPATTADAAEQQDNLRDLPLTGAQLQVGHYTNTNLTGTFVLNSANSDIAKETKNLVDNRLDPYFWSIPYERDSLKNYGGSMVPAILIDVANGGDGVAICGYEMILRAFLDCHIWHYDIQATLSADSDEWVSVFEDVDTYGKWDDVGVYHCEFDEVTVYKVRILIYDIGDADVAKDKNHYTTLTGTQTRFSLAEINLLAKRACSHSYDNACDTSCNSCGEERTTTHTWDAGKVTKAATCKATGVKTYTCTGCSSTKTEAVAKTAHSYNAATCTKAKTCKNCGATTGNANGHKYTEATCTKAATCKTCDATSGKALGHTYKDATCTAPKTCKVCKATSGKALGHSYKTTTTKATLSKDGSAVKKCTVCKSVASTKTIKYVKTVKLSKTSFVYNGKTQKPTVTVKDSAGKTLKKGTDYDVTYASGCKKAGTYKVTVKFKGNYSGTKTLTFKINPKAAISTQPKTQKVEAGEKIKFTVKATGTGLKYQWQVSTNGKTWKNCSGSAAKKASFSFTSKTSHDGNYYRCKVTDSAGNVVYTKAVRAYVLGIEKQPVKKTVTKNKTAKFTVDASGNGLKYQWQYSTNGGKTWKTCSGSAAKKAAYSFKAKISQNGYYFRCKITDSAKNVIYTSKVKLTVKK